MTNKYIETHKKEGKEVWGREKWEKGGGSVKRHEKIVLDVV